MASHPFRDNALPPTERTGVLVDDRAVLAICFMEREKRSVSTAERWALRPAGFETNLLARPNRTCRFWSAPPDASSCVDCDASDLEFEAFKPKPRNADDGERRMVIPR